MDIVIENLKKKYNKQLVLDIGKLSVKQGELVGIIGNNGAGKTTLFRLMLDLIEATDGQIFIDGKYHAENDHWKKKTGSYLDEGFLIDFLTPEEYFYFTGNIYGLTPSDTDSRIEPFKRFMHDEIIGQKKFIRQLSTGNKQKTGIMAAMIPQPPLLILDEPFNYLDPSSQILIKKMLKTTNEKHNTTILLSSHNLNHVIEICNRVILLEKGIVIEDLHLPTEDLKKLETYFALHA